MSDSLIEVGGLHVTSFAGGPDRGVCLAFDSAGSVAELTEENVADLMAAVGDWIARRASSSAYLTDRLAGNIAPLLPMPPGVVSASVAATGAGAFFVLATDRRGDMYMILGNPKKGLLDVMYSNWIKLPPIPNDESPAFDLAPAGLVANAGQGRRKHSRAGMFRHSYPDGCDAEKCDLPESDPIHD